MKFYLAHDTKLDGDVAFALIKTEGLNETSRASQPVLPLGQSIKIAQETCRDLAFAHSRAMFG